MSTYTPIASQTLGSASSTVTFSSLPQNYTDLILVANYGISANLYGLRIRFNSDTGSNYSDTVLYGDGSSAASSRDTSATSIITSAVGVSNNVLNYNIICNIQNYSNGSTYKTALIRANAANRETVACVGSWRNTDPINSITIFVGSGDILSGSTFTIYGVSAGNSLAKATGGNIVTTDGTYWYHTFTSSGTFIPSSALSADVLVVAGGGGGAYYYGSGGGAGGLLEQTGRSLSANTVYQAIIGAGGAKSPTSSSANNVASPGGNSIFDTITALGGGGGNGGINQNNSDSTSGGSSGGKQGGSASAATQGNSGGATGYGNVGTVNGVGGGGGGAGAAASGVNGGNGRANSFSGTSITYAGGGAGQSGTNGTGGGSTVNRGGGGKGDAENGGSGIIVIRYAV